MKKTAIYCRVSTEEQAREGFSIAAQKAKLKAFCISQGWDNYSFYVDEGISAKDMNRPELQRILDGIKKGEIERVIVYRLDRLTRSVLDLYKLLELFDKHDCKFKSATEVYDTTTAMGRMFITLVAALAQWERENLGERVSMGLQQKAKEGKWAKSTAPFGYDLRDKDYLEINEFEAEIVRKIFELYNSCEYGVEKIAMKLNKEGITTKKGNAFSNMAVKFIIENPIYIGKMRYHYRVNKENYFEIENFCDPIIDKETFDKAQSILSGRKFTHPRSATSSYIFSGVLKCPKCGGIMVGHKSTKTYKGTKSVGYNYRCQNSKIGTCSYGAMFAETLLEQKFMEHINSWIISEELKKEVKVSESKKVKKDDKLKKLYSDLKAIEARRKKWQYAWANDMLNDADFKQRQEEENELEEAIIRQIEAINDNEEKQYSKDALFDAIVNLKKSWSFLERNDKKQFVQLVIKEIIISKLEGYSQQDYRKIDFIKVEYN